MHVYCDVHVHVCYWYSGFWGELLVFIVVINLLAQLDAAKEDSDIDSILNKAENMAIINASN